MRHSEGSMRTRTAKARKRSRREPERQEGPPPEPAHGLIDLQTRAGNAAVTGLVARAPRTKEKPQDLAHLYADEARDVVRHLHDTYLDPASVRAIQSALGTPGTGWWNEADAQALSRFQVDRGLRRGGTYDYVRLDEKTIDAIVRKQVADGFQQEMIHLGVDWKRLDTSADTIAVRFDSNLGSDSAVTFEADTVRIVTVGPSALKSARSIARAVKSQLDPDPLAAMLAPTAVPSVLKPDEAQAAADYNAGRLDRRATLIVQRVIGANRTGELDAATAQFIARKQGQLGRAKPDGMLDDDLFHDCLSELWLNSDMEALVRLVVSYRQLNELGIVDVSFDASVDPADFRFGGAGDGAPTSIVFGPGAFAHGLPPSMEHTIARAFDEARVRMERKSGRAASFLAFKTDLLGTGLTD